MVLKKFIKTQKRKRAIYKDEFTKQRAIKEAKDFINMESKLRKRAKQDAQMGRIQRYQTKYARGAKKIRYVKDVLDDIGKELDKQFE